MKRTPIRPISDKQRRRQRALSKLKPPLDGRCQECRALPDFRGLLKHHIRSRAQGGSDSADNIRWLCGRCHDSAHGIGTKYILIDYEASS